MAMSPAGRRAPRITAVEVMATRSTKFTMPLQLGPMKRTPPARASAAARACSAAPSALPVSAKPEEKTVANWTPARAHCSSASGTAARRQHDADVVRRNGHVADARIAAQAEDAFALRVDRVDLAGKAEVDQLAHAAAAELADVFAGADVGDALRCKKPAQVRELAAWALAAGKRGAAMADRVFRAS